MTVSTIISKQSYNGNGVTTVFSFPYPFIAASDLVVNAVSAAGVAGSALILNTDYTISGTAPYPTGANITMTTPPASLTRVVAQRIRPLTQLLDLVENDPLPSADLEAGLDSEVMISQQLQDAISRAIVVPATDVNPVTALPGATARANTTLGFGPTGDVLLGAISTVLVSSVMTPVVQAATLALARTALGLGSMAVQNANAIAVTGGAIAGTAITASTVDSSVIGATTPAAASVTSLNGGQLAGCRNLVINGSFRVWEQNTVQALTTTAAYLAADRWASYMATSAAGIANQSAAVPANLGFRYSLKLGRNSGSSLANNITTIQALETEDTIPAQGQQMTISYYAKAGANYSSAANALSAIVITGTGTDQSAATGIAGSWTGSATAINTADTLTTSFQRFQHNFTMPAGATQALVAFAYAPVGTAGADDNVYITGVQLEYGPVATPFEHRKFTHEKQLCQRFKHVINYAAGALIGWGYSTSNNTYDVCVPLGTPLRIPPTASTLPTSVPTPANTTVNATASTIASSALAVSTGTLSTPDVFVMTGNTGSGLTGGAGMMLRWTGASSGQVVIGAEL